MQNTANLLAEHGIPVVQATQERPARLLDEADEPLNLCSGKQAKFDQAAFIAFAHQT